MKNARDIATKNAARATAAAAWNNHRKSQAIERATETMIATQTIQNI